MIIFLLAGLLLGLTIYPIAHRIWQQIDNRLLPATQLKAYRPSIK